MASGVAFFGDGASNQGTILESMNLANVWNLPMIFLAENNGYAESTGVKYNVPTPNIADRAAGFRHAGRNGRRQRFLCRLRSSRRSDQPCP